MHWQGRFFKRVFLRLGALLCLGMLLVCAVTWQIMHRWLAGYTQDQIIKQAHLAKLTIDRQWPLDEPALQRECDHMHELTGLRLTVMAPDGRVLADSNANPSEMENHAKRPEMAAALAGRMGQDLRRSSSVGENFVYIAVPLIESGRLAAVVRVAAPAADIKRREEALIKWITIGLAIAIPLALLGAWVLSKALAQPVQRVSILARRLSTGDLQERVEVGGDDEIWQVAESLETMRENLLARVHEVQQQRKDLEVTVSHLEEGIITVDRAGLVLTANDAARRLLAVDSPLVGRLLTEQVTDEALQQMWNEAQAAGRNELHRELKRSKVRGAAQLSVTIIRVTEPSTPIAWLICIRDITALAQSAAMKTEFVANASHELRTPVASIRAAVETLNADGLDREMTQRFMSVIARNVERLQNLTEDLMDLNRVESESPDLSVRRFRPDEVFASVRSVFAEALRQKSVRLEIVNEVEALETDPRWLELVLKNLVDNAVKFVGIGGRIEIRCRHEGGMARLEVEDNGCGIPAGDLDRVFERFYQVDKSRRVGIGGTGLGLAIVKHAVHGMGGEVSIASEEGRFTRVSFTVPVAAVAV
ncbi:MAG: hypothetical protein DCC66_10180 [Planctomycetota bacterium]|nr:MAG: hypothetical protein DCC66_10180 [Planctomycetota bacterium]